MKMVFEFDIFRFFGACPGVKVSKTSFHEVSYEKRAPKTRPHDWVNVWV